MQLLVYILVYPFLWLISIFPFRLLYAFSDFIFIWIYHIIGYRKKIVLQNLELVFPEKEKSDLLKIRKDFYHHMCDLFLEMLKGMSMSKTEMAKRYSFSNMALLKELEKSKSILIVCAHYANWEWNVSINNFVQSEGYAIYQKIGNVYFDRLIKRIRAKWNTTLITQQETVKTVMLNHKNNINAIYGMVSDQSPQVRPSSYWSDFMGIKVPVFKGPEAMATKMDLAVVFLHTRKVKRGYYKAEFIPITEAGKSTKPNEITEQFLRLAEKQIREAPQYYLWTHKRWKHRHRYPKD